MNNNHVEVVAASRHPYGDATIYTVHGRLPTVALAQLNTHGWFARSAASMRAIPTDKLLAAVEADPYIPHFGANQRGMVAGADIDDPRCEATVREALANAIRTAKQLAHLGVHKEVVNRYLTPWTWTRVVVTGIDQAWANFLALRNHDDAYPPLRDFARSAGKVIRDCAVTNLDWGQWHLPYVGVGGRVEQSVARCARVSYRSMQDPTRAPSEAEDQALYQKLVGSNPKHASPAEHQVEPAFGGCCARAGRHGPLWRSHRQDLVGERITDLTAELQRLD